MLQLGDTDFVNHYLNLLVFTNQNNQIKQQQYSAEVKFLAAVRALTGTRNLINNITQHANSFIVNDRAKSRVLVYNTTDLLTQIEKTQANGYNVLTTSDLPRRLDNTALDGKYPDYDKAVKRITGLLAQLHAYKIHLSIRLTKVPEN